MSAVMYGCWIAPNRKLNHTNLICGRGNQITCFGQSISTRAGDEFILVRGLSERGVFAGTTSSCRESRVARRAWRCWRPPYRGYYPVNGSEEHPEACHPRSPRNNIEKALLWILHFHMLQCTVIFQCPSKFFNIQKFLNFTA